MALASTLLTRIERQANDEGAVRWTRPAQLDYFHEGRRLLARAFPTRFNLRQVVTLAQGVEQTLPATAVTLRAIRPMGPEGLTPGAIIHGPSDRTTQDILTPRWREETGSAVEEWFRDDPFSLTYFVRPGPATTPQVKVELDMTAVPADLTEATVNTTDSGIPADLEPLIVAWVLFRIFSEETEEGAPAKAAGYRAQLPEDFA